MSNSMYKVLFYGICLSLVLLFASSCIDDDNSDCYVPCGLTVEAYDAEGNKLGGNDVRSVTLYLFDKDDKFVDMVDVPINTKVELNYPDHPDLKIVGWGNITGKTYKAPTLSRGAVMSEPLLELTKRQYLELEIADEPNDLFYGSLSTAAAATRSLTQDHVMPIYRKSSRVAVTVRNMKEYFNSFDDEYSLVIGKTHGALDYYGRYTGSKVAYDLTGIFNSNGEYITPVLNTYASSTGEDVSIYIYHRNTLLATAIKDDEGNSFRLKEGELLNVLITFPLNPTGDISITMAITPWEEVVIWKDYQ